MTAIRERIQSPLLYIRVCVVILLLLWGVFTMVNTGTLILSGATISPADPFEGYEHIRPGQHRDVLNTHSFTCNITDSRYAQTKYCTYQPPTGSLSMVEVFIDQYDKITEVDFTLRNGLCKVGDLVLLWGKPTVHPHANSINFIWQNGLGATSEYSRHVSFSLSVQKVYFMAQDNIANIAPPRKE